MPIRQFRTAEPQSLVMPTPTHPSRSALFAALVAAMLGAPLGAQQSGSQALRSEVRSGSVSVTVTAAIVLPDMSVRPLPIFALELRRTDDSSKVVTLRTGLSGSISQALDTGSYRLRSVQSATIGDSVYRWDTIVEIQQPAQVIELTNVNAIVSAAPKVVARQVAPEREVFERIRRGVFRVEAGLGHGTGFLIGDLGGLVVTNDHVIGNSIMASVYLDSVTRVAAQVVARDREADLALLRIAANRIEGLPRLPIAVPPEGEGLVVAGERVLAIGFPLNQEMTLTTGIASSIRDGAIISDVNINHGNSGGPMLNLAGEVVGVNTFGDLPENGGPGISGAVAISRLQPLLAQAPEIVSKLPAVEDRLLPVMPSDVYTSALIKAAADSVSYREYRKLVARGAGNFNVTFATPVMMRVLQLKEEAEVAGDRRKREERAGIASEERYSELGTGRDWERYVGARTAPVVTVYIEPKLGETFWSALGRGLEASQYGRSTSAARMKFHGDVRGVRFYRNGVEIEPIRGGHGPQPIKVDNEWVVLKDVVDRGYYVLPPEAFAPDSSGAPARVFVAIQDLKNPKVMSVVEISGDQTARIWNDFAAYYQALQKPFQQANPRVKAPRISMGCDPGAGTCAPGKPKGYYAVY